LSGFAPNGEIVALDETGKRSFNLLQSFGVEDIC
jgi:hypothetical protein